MTLFDKINLGIGGAVAGSVIWLFTTFASASDINDVKQKHDEDMDRHEEGFIELRVEQWYGQFYDRLDDRDESIDEGNEQLAAEYERQMERLRAKICEHDPEWERC